MAETWVLNATIALPSSVINVPFTSKGIAWTAIKKVGASSSPTMQYISPYKTASVYTTGAWVDDAYRTLVFDAAPSGALLTWLQANGVKQSDPEPENPTNACMIDGTVYSIKIGQTLVGGTAQTIYNGRTLVSSTGYDIVLSSSGFAVTITGTGVYGIYTLASAEINGTTYTSAATVKVESGTAITLSTSANKQSSNKDTKIIIDGATVAQGSNYAAASYTYTPTGDITISLSIGRTNTLYWGIITVTTS